MPCPPSAEADDYQFYTGLERLIYTGSSQQHPGRTEYFIPALLLMPPPARAPGRIIYPGADCAVSRDSFCSYSTEHFNPSHTVFTLPAAIYSSCSHTASSGSFCGIPILLVYTAEFVTVICKQKESVTQSGQQILFCFMFIFQLAIYRPSSRSQSRSAFLPAIFIIRRIFLVFIFISIIIPPVFTD